MTHGRPVVGLPVPVGYPVAWVLAAASAGVVVVSTRLRREIARLARPRRTTPDRIRVEARIAREGTERPLAPHEVALLVFGVIGLVTFVIGVYLVVEADKRRWRK